MTFPASVDTVTLTVGPLYDAGGLPRRGVPLTVTLAQVVTVTGEAGMVLPSVTTARTDETGVASVVVVATDSAGVDITGWMYHVVCRGVIPAGGINVALPAANPAVAVQDLVGVLAGDGSTVWTPARLADTTVAGLVADVDSDTRAALDALAVDSLDDLADVNTPTPSDGQVLTWDATPGEWVAATVASRVLIIDSGVYPARPDPAGDPVVFVGDVDPDAAMSPGDIWVDTSPSVVATALDSGPRSFASLINAATTNLFLAGSAWKMARVGSMCIIDTAFFQSNGGPAVTVQPLRLPLGFRPIGTVSLNSDGDLYITSDGWVNTTLVNWSTPSQDSIKRVYLTKDAWPDPMPGAAT